MSMAEDDDPHQQPQDDDSDDYYAGISADERWAIELRLRTDQIIADGERARQDLEAAREWQPNIGLPAITLIDIDEIRERRRARLEENGYLDLDGFLHQDEPDHDWLVPGLLERGDRVILTGQEGKGKSTLLRQLAVQIAAGIHPFTLEPTSPKRVLLIDLENSRRHVRRQLRPLRLSAPDLPPGNMIPVVSPAGIDLLDKEDANHFTELVDLITPDLLVIGPSYKLAGGDPTSEEVARKVTHQLDRLREHHEFAVILEAHQPYPNAGKRVERPYGASLWSRWPEFGLHLADGGELRHWRGDRDEREWPPALTRGGQWPWTAITDTKTVTWARIRSLLLEEGRGLSEREIADALGSSKTQVHRAVEANRKEFEMLLLETTEL